MKNKNLIYGIIALLFLTGLSFFIWNNYQIKSPPRNSEECVAESCHGLNIICGPNTPEFCSMMYAAGDNCRQYANCQLIDGQCKLEKSPKFENCKSCVEKCELDYKDDVVNFFECESKCR